MMKKIFAFLLVLCFTLSFYVFSNAEEIADEETIIICDVEITDYFEPGKVLVVLKKSATVINKVHTPESFGDVGVVSVEDLSYITNEAARKWVDKGNYHQILALTLENDTKQGVINAIRKLEQRSDVLNASPNYTNTVEAMTGTNAEDVSELEMAAVHSNNTEISTNQYPYSTIKLPQAWEITTGSPQVKVGVFDGSGIDNHEDLYGNISSTLGVNLTAGYENSWVDQGSHGTQVAGIIGAVGNNEKGIAGVCWSVELVSIQVKCGILGIGYSPDTLGSIEWQCKGMQYAINNMISILNMSMNSVANVIPFSAAIGNYPGLLVVSAGNYGRNVDNEEDRVGGDVYPDLYTYDNMIVVAASTATDGLLSNSNYGATSVDLAAPGVDIMTTYGEAGYKTASGTSFAAPFVAGTAALIKSIRPDLTSREIKDIILSSVDEIPALEGKVATGGRLNVYAALQMAQDYAKRGELLAGDFDGDGTDEVAAFFQEKEDGENSAMKLRVWESTDTRYDSLSGEQWGNVTLYGYDAIEGRIAVGDFDGDGDDDIVTLCDRGLQSNGTYTSWVVVWRNYHDRRRSMAVTTAMMADFAASRFTDRVAAGDFNGDGCCDLIGFCNETVDGAQRLVGWVWQGNANMNFPYARRIQFALNADNITGRVTAGDFNGDGCDDVATLYDYGVQADGNSKMMILAWHGFTNGNLSSFAPYSDNDFDVNTVVGISSGDFNGDGYDDIVALYDYSVESGYARETMLWYSRGASGYFFESADACLSISFNIGDVQGGLISGDFDGDGDEEVRMLTCGAGVTALWEYSCFSEWNIFSVSAVWYQY